MATTFYQHGKSVQHDGDTPPAPLTTQEAAPPATPAKPAKAPKPTKAVKAATKAKAARLAKKPKRVVGKHRK